MLTRNRLVVVVICLLALGAVVVNALVSSQGLTITAAAVEGALPIDAPTSELWQQTTAVEVPLTAQMIARPIMPETNVKAVTVRALHNGADLAVLLDGSIPPRNDATLRVNDFHDGAALQFPLRSRASPLSSVSKAAMSISGTGRLTGRPR